MISNTLRTATVLALLGCLSGEPSSPVGADTSSDTFRADAAPESADAPPGPLSSWREIGGPAPVARWGHVAGWDAARDRMIVFGGTAQGARDDTWEFRLSDESWRQLEAGPGPSARFTPGLVADPERDRLVVYGGDDGAPRDDVWALDLGTDTWSAVGTGPSARFDVAVASAGRRAWFFGGFGPGFVALNELWALDLDTDTWSLVEPASEDRPSPRTNLGFGHFDGWLYAVGGHGASDVLTPSTWRFSLEARVWQELQPAGEPRAITHFSGAVDPACGALWLFGGDRADSVDSDELVAYRPLDGFVIAGPSPRPPARRHATLIYSDAPRRLVLFGGWQGPFDDLGDTWVLDDPPCPP